jgi:hypothetical protein
LLLFVACQRNRDFVASEAVSSFAPAEAEADIAFAGEAEASAFTNSATGDVGSAVNVPPAQAQERLIIRTGILSIVVEDTEETLVDITRLAEGNGGWVVSSNVFQSSGDVKSGEVTVRIPAEGFSRAMETIKAMAIEVTNELTSGKDFTDEFVDLSSRLGNLEATASRVRNFLDETKNVEEALAVNAELSRLEEQIEVIKGRMQFLEQSAAFSTIAVNLTPDELSRPIEVPEGVARDAVEALLGILEGVANFLIWLLIYLLPLILLLGISVWIAIRTVRRRRRRQATQETEQDQKVGGRSSLDNGYGLVLTGSYLMSPAAS